MARQRRQSQGFGRSVAAPASTGAWEIALRPLPASLEVEEDLGDQPVVWVVVEVGGLVRALLPARAESALALLPELLELAIHDPSPGCRRGRPSRVVISNPALLEPLATLLDGVPLRQGPTPDLDEAMAAFGSIVPLPDGQEWFSPGPLQSWLSADAPPATVAAWFAAAAELHARRPWDRFPQEGHLFRVTCSQLGIRQWLGFAAPGDANDPLLHLFESEADYWEYEQYVSRMDRAESTGVPFDEPWPRQIVLAFLPLHEQNAPVRAEVRRHGWPLAAGDVAPGLIVLSAPGLFGPPTAHLLRQLQAVALALVHWIDHDQDPASRWLRRLPPTRYRVPVDGLLVPVSIGAFAGPPRRPGGVWLDPLQTRVATLLEQLDAFCAARLDGDYRELFHRAVESLASQHTAQLLKGRESSWCAGLVYAIGSANFLFERSQQPHCTSKDVFGFFGVSSSVGYAHAKKVRDLLAIEPLSPRWTLRSLQQPSADPQMVMVNGLTVDVRKLPAAVTLKLCAQLLQQVSGAPGGVC